MTLTQHKGGGTSQSRGREGGRKGGREEKIVRDLVGTESEKESYLARVALTPQKEVPDGSKVPLTGI